MEQDCELLKHERQSTDFQKSHSSEPNSLLLEVFNQLLGLVVFLLQSLVLALGLLQVLVDRVAEGLRLDPVALQLHHPLLVVLYALPQLGFLLLPALLLLPHGLKLERGDRHAGRGVQMRNL